MANEVEIHVTAKDDTGNTFSAVRGKAKKAGGDAGDEFTGAFAGKVGKAPPPKVKVDADDQLAKAKIAELAAAKNAAVVKIDADIAKAEARIKSLEDQRGKTKLDVDAEVTKAKAKIDALVSKRERIELQLDVDTEKVLAKTRKATDEVKKEVDKAAKDTQQSFNALQFTVLTAGLPAAALVGAAGASAALAAIPALFIGYGAAALKGNAQVADSFSGLKDHVVTDSQQMAGVLAGPLSDSATRLGASFDHVKPEITSAMADSREAVGLLTDTVNGFAENAAPAFVVAVRNSQAPLKGLQSFAADTGAGLTDMFVNLSKSGDAAGRTMVSLGGVTRDLEGFVGQLLANFASGGAAVVPQFGATLHQVEDTVLSLSSNGMPALTGAAGHLLSTVSGGIGILQAGASALGSWAAPLGGMAGNLFATNSMAKLFGTSLGETGFGVGAFAKTVQDGDQKISPFKKSLQDAETNGTSKLKAGLGALVSNGVNPMGIAMIAGGFILDKFGEAQQKAAEYAAQHRENVRTLTDAIREDGGVMGTATAQTNSKALADKNAAANLNAFGQTVQTATAAINGNYQAYDKLQYAAGATLATIADQAGIVGNNRDELISLGKTSLETGKNYDQLKASVLATGITYDSSGESSQRLTAAQQSLIEATLNGTGAVGEQINAQKQAHESYIASETALTGLTQAQIENRDATNKATQAIYAEQNAHLGYRGAVLNTKTAIDEYDKTLKNGKATADQKAASLLKVEQAFASQEQAAYNAAFAENANKSSGEQLAAANAAANAETVKLANSMGGQLPQSVQQTIGQFSLAQAKAAGLTVAIDGTGRAVYRLPDGKFIAITSSAQDEARQVAALQRAIDSIHDRNVRIAVTTFYGTVGQGSSLTGPAVARAKGGLVGYASGGKVLSVPRFDGGGYALDVGPGGMLHGPGSGTSDSIFARVSNGEFVVKASETRKNLPLLNAINSGRVGGIRGGASGGVGGVGGGQVAVRLEVHAGGAGDFERMFAELIRRYVRVQGGGNVQATFGRS